LRPIFEAPVIAQIRRTAPGQNAAIPGKTVGIPLRSMPPPHTSRYAIHRHLDPQLIVWLISSYPHYLVMQLSGLADDLPIYPRPKNTLSRLVFRQEINRASQNNGRLLADLDYAYYFMNVMVDNLNRRSLGLTVFPCPTRTPFARSSAPRQPLPSARDGAPRG
jgi:hypothetical protein